MLARRLLVPLLAAAALGACSTASDPVGARPTAVTVDGPSTVAMPTSTAGPATTAPGSGTAASTAVPAPSTTGAATTATTAAGSSRATTPAPTTAATAATAAERPPKPTAVATAPAPPTSSTLAPLVAGRTAYGYLVGVQPGPVVLIDVVERFTGVEARRAAAADGATLPAGQDVYVRNGDAEPSSFRVLEGAKVVVTECTASGCLEQRVPVERLPLGGRRLAQFVPAGGNGLSELAVPGD